MTSRHDDVIA